MILQQLIRYTNANALEATWNDADGNILRCHAYSNHPEQIAMLRADLGADAANHEALIAEVEATYTPPPIPEPVVPTICTSAHGLVALYAVKGSPKRM